MPSADKQAFKSAHFWSALACFLFLLAKALAVVPAVPSLPSKQGAVALRWQDQKPTREAEAAAESRRAYLASSRTRSPADAGGGQDLVLPTRPLLVSLTEGGERRTLGSVSVSSPFVPSGFRARAPPPAIG